MHPTAVVRALGSTQTTSADAPEMVLTVLKLTPALEDPLLDDMVAAALKNGRETIKQLRVVGRRTEI